MATEHHSRLLMFDVWRIIAVMLIVAIHISIAPNLRFPILYQEYDYIGLLHLLEFKSNIGGLGVELFVILSGCVIEYTYGSRIRDHTFSFIRFISKRMVRLYPAYWLSLMAAVMVSQPAIRFGLVETAKIVSGFWIFTTIFSNVPDIQQPLNAMGWFIGMILCLYLAYPFISKFISSFGAIGVLIFFILSYETGLVLFSISPGGMDTYWFPITRLFEFALGIYIVQKRYYFKTVTSNSAIRFLSDLCFPVFLIHYILLPVLLVIPQAYYANVALYAICVLAMSMCLLKFSQYTEKITGVYYNA